MKSVLSHCLTATFVYTLLLALLILRSTRAVTMKTNTQMKRVLVTGANKGIGRAICELLLEKHPDVHVLLGSRDRGRGEKAIEDIRASVGTAASTRLELMEIDTSSDESVKKAAAAASKGGSLYGIVNNAGIGPGNSVEDAMNTNYFGPRRVNDAFQKLLVKPGGRIVNVSSASGPNFVSSCDDSELRKNFAEPLSISGGVQGLDDIAKLATCENSYGLSKAALNAYTVLHAKQEPDLIINACSPGFIATDMGVPLGARNPPSKGAVAPVHLLMSEEIAALPTGRYYGSDGLRSPLDRYRSPGDPPYDGL